MGDLDRVWVQRYSASRKISAMATPQSRESSASVSEPETLSMIVDQDVWQSLSGIDLQTDNGSDGGHRKGSQPCGILTAFYASMHQGRKPGGGDSALRTWPVGGSFYAPRNTSITFQSVVSRMEQWAPGFKDPTKTEYPSSVRLTLYSIPFGSGPFPYRWRRATDIARSRSAALSAGMTGRSSG